MDKLFSADPLVTIVRNMRIIKIILYYLLLASSLYAGTGIISPLYGTGWHFSLASMYWAVFSVLFVGSDLWLHHKISRLIALSILALTYLMSFEYYLFCDEYRFVVHQGSNEKIFQQTQAIFISIGFTKVCWLPICSWQLFFASIDRKKVIDEAG